MSVSDTIADMLTMIRNANRAGHEKVDIPASKMKLEILKIFKNEGFIKNFKMVGDGKYGILRVYLKYKEDRNPVIHDLKRVSRPSLRVYRKADELPRLFNGMGTVVISTSKGILTDRKSREKHLGGEVVCYIW